MSRATETPVALHGFRASRVFAVRHFPLVHLWVKDGILPTKEFGMDDKVDVTIPVDAEAAATLAAMRNREAIGRLVSRVLRPRAGPSPLTQAIAEMKADARQAGLADADIDAELAAYNAERRDRHGAD